MPATVQLIETTTTLGLEVVSVSVIASATPGPAGPGVPVGGTDGQVLTKTSATDYATAWEDPTGGGGGAPTDADYLVGTANGTLSAEIVVGTSPGGELGGTWAAPTVDATHSGSSHAGVQAAAEATAAAALSAHEADTTSVHGISNTANLYSVGGTDVAVADGGTGASTAAGARANLDLEAGTDFPSLATFNDHSARHENGGADEISIAGLDGMSTELAAHLADAADAHDASAISVLDTGGNYTATDVEAVLAEIAPQLGGGGGTDWEYETRSTNTILGVADKGKVIDITATITQTFEADETLGDGWYVILRNASEDGTTVVTLDPAGAETIDGLATVTMYSGETRFILCNGSGGNFNSVMLRGGYALFTADGSFVIPHGCQTISPQPIGGGGGGGGGRGRSAGQLGRAGGGGGGGAAPLFHFRSDELGSPGDSITITMGAGGAGGNGGSGANGTAGSAGGITTFGSFARAYGGGGGSLGSGTTSNSGASGGGGGGASQVGGVGSDNGDSTGGNQNGGGVPGAGYEGAGCNRDTPDFGQGMQAVFGGASGGGSPGDASGAGREGGSSIHGGGGGGAGGPLPTTNTERAGGPGGATGVFTPGSGAAGGAVNGGAGTAGSNLGEGGGGGGAQDSGTGGAGGNGAVGGGGGGGGGTGTTVGGAGGEGGDGACKVWYS